MVKKEKKEAKQSSVTLDFKLNLPCTLHHVVWFSNPKNINKKVKLRNYDFASTFLYHAVQVHT